MKKLILASLLSITLASPVYADFAWYTPTQTHLYKRLVSDDKEYSPEQGGVYKIRYSSKFNRLGESLDANVSKNNGYLQVDAKGEFAGECVSFVKAAANVDKQTSSWIPNKQVGVDYIKIGRAVALFGPDGKYPQGGNGHTCIYLGEDRDGMWILDQNWAGRVVTIHKIRFRNKPNNGPGKGDGDRNNAYSYFTFK